MRINDAKTIPTGSRWTVAARAYAEHLLEGPAAVQAAYESVEAAQRRGRGDSREAVLDAVRAITAERAKSPPPDERIRAAEAAFAAEAAEVERWAAATAAAYQSRQAAAIARAQRAEDRRTLTPAAPATIGNERSTNGVAHRSPAVSPLVSAPSFPTAGPSFSRRRPRTIVSVAAVGCLVIAGGLLAAVTIIDDGSVDRTSSSTRSEQSVAPPPAAPLESPGLSRRPRDDGRAAKPRTAKRERRRTRRPVRPAVSRPAVRAAPVAPRPVAVQPPVAAPPPVAPAPAPVAPAPPPAPVTSKPPSEPAPADEPKPSEPSSQPGRQPPTR